MPSMFSTSVQFVAGVATIIFLRRSTSEGSNDEGLVSSDRNTNNVQDQGGELDEGTALADSSRGDKSRDKSRQRPSYAAAAARAPLKNDAMSHHSRTTNNSFAIVARSSDSTVLPTSDGIPPTRSDVGGAATRTLSTSQADLERISSKVKQLEAELSQMRDQHTRLGRQVQDANRQLTDERQASRQREDSMNAALVEAERRLQALKADGAATRVFAESEHVDGKAIIDHFNDVVDGFNDLLFCVMEKLDENELMAVIQIERVVDLAKANGEAGNLLHSFLAPMSAARARVELVALPVMQAMAFRVLCDYLFHPMGLADQVPHEAVRYFEYLRKRVSSTESQEKYGRWRAITYSAMRQPENDDELARFIAIEIFRKLEEVIIALLPAAAIHDGHLGQKLFGDLFATATKAILDAIKLQDKIQRVYVSHDYSVYLPNTNVHFSVADMDSVDLGPDATKELARAVHNVRGARGTVLLPVMPGLRATRVGQNLPDMEVVVKKASVVALL